MPNPRAKPDGRRGRMIRFSDAEWTALRAACETSGTSMSEAIRRLAAGIAAAGAGARQGPRRVFACAYCPAEFATEFDAEAHIDSQHHEPETTP